MSKLIFRSGFEPDCKVVADEKEDDIVGADRSVEPPNDWERDLEGYEKFGSFRLQYQGGEEEDRHARIIEEPGNPGNHVLRFWMKNPRTPSGPNRFKGRIQANIYGNENLTEVYQKRRLFIPEETGLLRQFPGSFGWFTLEELWLAAGWIRHPFPFRITMNLSKGEGAGRPLHFDIHGQVQRENGKGWHPTIWHETCRDFEVPIGQWMTLETYYLQGDDTSGRIVIHVQPEGDERVTVFDVTNWTYSPRATEPVPMTHWNPMKMYTSGEIVDLVRESGGVLQLYYDDIEIWDGRPS